MRKRIVERRAVQHHLSAEVARCHNLRDRRELRHHDHRWNAEDARGKRHTLRVITSAGGDHAALALLFAQVGDLVVGAANFERAGALQRLRFEIDARAQLAREAQLRQHGRLDDLIAQGLLGSVNVG